MTKNKLLNMSQFAELVGISRQGVSKKVKKGELTKRPDGKLDITEKTNAHYIKTKAQDKKYNESKKRAKKKNPDLHPTNKNGNDSEDFEDEPLPKDLLSCDKRQLEEHKLIRQIKQIDLNDSIKRGDLIEKDLIKNLFSSIFEIHMNEFLTIKEKLVPDIAAIFEVIDPEKANEAGERMDEELWKTLKHIKKEINKFLNSIKSEEI